MTIQQIIERFWRNNGGKIPLAVRKQLGRRG